MEFRTTVLDTLGEEIVSEGCFCWSFICENETQRHMKFAGQCMSEEAMRRIATLATTSDPASGYRNAVERQLKDSTHISVYVRT